MNRSILAMSVASLLPYASFSQAQELSTDETVIVTANRFEQSLDSIITPVEVVTREDIDAIQAKSLSEVLQRLPGIQISATGGYGQSQSIFVRGTNSSHVVVLIDGVRTGSATLGSPNISGIPLTGVQRIEYIRGSRAVMYGADALGGVINIITSNDQEEVMLSTSVGSDNYWQGNIAIAHKASDKLHFSVSTSATRTDGFSAKSTPGDEDDDGYESQNVTANMKYQANDVLTFGFQGLYHVGEVDYDPQDANKDETIYNAVVYADYSSEQLFSKLAVSNNRDKSQDYYYSSLYQTDRTAIAWSNLYRIDEVFALGGGIDWYRDDVSDSSVDYIESKRDNMAVYLSSYASTNEVDAELAVRFDDNERYGEYTTWQAGAGWRFLPHYRLTASAGTAFKAPTFNNLYYPGGGNANLKPEESTNYEIAIDANYDWATIRLGAYRNEITNLIVGWPAENTEEAEINGVELTGEFYTGPLLHTVSFEYLDPKDKASGKQLARRAKDNYKWNISYIRDGWIADLSYLYQGDRIDTNDELMESYNLVDFALSYEFQNGVVMRGKIANLFDENYVLASDYNTQERSYFGTLEYRF